VEGSRLMADLMAPFGQEAAQKKGDDPQSHPEDQQDADANR